MAPPVHARSARRLTVALAWWLVGWVAIGSLALVYVVHSECIDPGPPVLRPEAGSPRAHYCAVADTGSLWLLPIAAVLIVGLVIVVGRRRKLCALVAAVVALGALLANTLYVDSLHFAYTI